MITVPDDSSLWSATRRLVQTVRDQRVESPSGRSGWVTYRDLDNGLRVESTKGLYAGDLGPILFLAAADRVLDTGSSVWHNCVNPWLTDQPELMNTPGVGLVNGVGAHVYGMTNLYRLTGDDRFLDVAHRFALSVDTETIRTVPDLDLNVGLTGYLISLLCLLTEREDEAVIDKAVACGDRLLNETTTQDGGLRWSLGGDGMTRGFAHGNAGPSLGLALLGDRAGMPRFTRAATQGFSLEQDQFGVNDTHTQTVETPAVQRGWCCGVSGLTVARIRANDHLREELAVEVEHSSELLASGLENSDVICHGTFSKVGTLNFLSEQTTPVSPRAARSLACAAVERRQDVGNYQVPFGGLSGTPNSGFFTGLSGIGYTLLRVLSDEPLPFIMGFE